MQLNTTLNRFDGLDILRGFAATAVVCIHVWALGGFGGLGVLTDKIVGNYFGIAVPLFYALSAFSLLYGYDRILFDEFNMKKFYIRRFFRLAPLFYVLLAVNLIQVFFLYGVKFDLAKTLLNITFMYSVVPTQHESLVPAGWSIGIEWIFYFMFPLVVLISRSKILLFIVTIVFTIISINYASFITAVSPVSPSLNTISIVKHFVFFLIGAVVYKLLPYVEMIKQKLKWIKKIEVVYILFTFSIFYIFGKFVNMVILEAVFFLLLLFWALIGFSKLFNNGITRTLGRCSYGLYLLNPLLVDYLSRLHYFEYIRKLFQGNSHAIFLSYTVSSVTSLFIITLVSMITYRFIEQPSIRLGNKLIEGIKIRNKMVTASKTITY